MQDGKITAPMMGAALMFILFVFVLWLVGQC
jgi:hypothetical protein